ncbi:MAG: leucine-rich repeat protein [Clostridium sp.]|nr:leucine-rich repeat protein [Clostridium sp.]
MKKHYYLASLLLSATLAISCSNDADDMIQPETNTTASTGTEATLAALDFPQDDGATLLSGSDANKMLTILRKIDPKQALVMGETVITEEQYQEIKTFTDNLVSGCTTDHQKYDAIFAWVSNNVKYDLTSNDPYDVFINRTGVCQGYSNLMKVMLLSQDIPVLIANGLMMGFGHAWNYTYLDGQWWLSDATNKGEFDAANTGAYYFMYPQRADITLFEDDKFAYDYYNSQLNVAEIKEGYGSEVIPFSIGGIRITSVNPHSTLPETINELYLGKNIETLGTDLIGLREYGKNLKSVHVDEANKKLMSYEGAVYERGGNGNNYLYYIPAQLTDLKLLPMTTVEKNTVFDQPNLQTIEIASGTERIESYAFEKCPRLERAYVPLNTIIEEDAFYNVGPTFEIIRRNGTGITNVYM